MEDINKIKENLPLAKIGGKVLNGRKTFVEGGLGRIPLSCKTNILDSKTRAKTKLGKKNKKVIEKLGLGFSVSRDQPAAPQLSTATPTDSTAPQTELPTDASTNGAAPQTQSAAADVTAEEPSAEYWRALAETRQRALEMALMENQKLDEQVSLLQQENGLLQEALQRAEDVVASVQEWADEQQRQ